MSRHECFSLTKSQKTNVILADMSPAIEGRLCRPNQRIGLRFSGISNVTLHFLTRYIQLTATFDSFYFNWPMTLLSLRNENKYPKQTYKFQRVELDWKTNTIITVLNTNFHYLSCVSIMHPFSHYKNKCYRFKRVYVILREKLRKTYMIGIMKLRVR